MKPLSPGIDTRSFAELLHLARAMAPYYLPEWDTLQDRDPGVALLKIYLNLYELVIDRLNQVPDKNLIAFLDMAGIQQRRAQTAEAAVVFTLANGTRVNVPVLKGSELTGEGTNEEGASETVIFRTKNDLLVSYAQLQEVFSADPRTDAIFAHMEKDKSVAASFTILEGTTRQEHALYLGHQDLFNINGTARITLELDIPAGASENENERLKFIWEYWNGSYWVKLAEFDPDKTVTDANGTNVTDTDNDSTNAFQHSGKMELIKANPGEIAEGEFFGQPSHWLRCRLLNPISDLVPLTLPALDTILVSVSPEGDIVPDLLFNNDIPLNIAPIKIPMKAMEGIEISFPVDSDNETLAPKAGDQTIKLDVSGGKLKKGDALKFDNGFDDAEIHIIENITETDDIEYLLRRALAFDYDVVAVGTPPVTMYTAIRNDGESSRLSVGSLDGYEIPMCSKVILSGRGKKDIVYIGPPSGENENGDNDILILINYDGTTPLLTYNYIENETVQIIPQITPFGEKPRLFSTFYIACDEAFSKKNATVTLKIEAAAFQDADDAVCSQPAPDPDVVISWEYWNGQSWRGLRVQDTTHNLTAATGSIIFTCPDDIETIEVNGEEKYWIRARIVDGNYGDEFVFLPGSNGTDIDLSLGCIHYPIIKELTITYDAASRQLQHCLARNNLSYQDHTHACKNNGVVFFPFMNLPETAPTLFLGFDQPLTSGPLQMLFDLNEQVIPEDERLKISWFFWNGNQWDLIQVEDGTENLTRVGILQWIGSRHFAPRELFGKTRYWLKGSIVEGRHQENPQINGIYLNAVDTFQAARVEDEPLGGSDGTPDQTFTVLKPPIISQDVWVREPETPEEDELRALSATTDNEEVLQIVRDERGEILEIWVRWKKVDDFEASTSGDRHYRVDQRLGEVQFGNGENGLVPPIGEDNIKINYLYGGGKIGNVPAGSINGLKNAIPFVQAVTNPLPADSGAETESLDFVCLRGPQTLKNRERAVGTEDFEWMARNASRKVARAKCLPNIDENGDFTPGWVTVLIAPDSSEAKPRPTRQLLKTVSDRLRRVAANILAVTSPDHIHVREPVYVEIVVEAIVTPLTPEDAARVENRVLDTLNKYIHPLTGGRDGAGWPFGKTVCRADIIALLEGVEKVDVVKRLTLYADGKAQSDDVKLDHDTLPYSGEHRINLVLAEGTVNSIAATTLASNCVSET
ncbi:MAG: putative baseplate assembly protein [Calditrichaeota bacterium]|nr:putative baseplate assembly protein [Calditrichota bacterium]